MNLSFNFKIEDSSRIFELTKACEEIKQEIVKLAENPRFELIRKSPVPLLLTLIVNKKDSDLPRIHVEIPEALASDHTFYSFQACLLKISLPNEVANCNIVISTVKADSQTKEENTPTYEASIPKWDFDQIILSEDVRKRLFRAISIIENKDIIWDVLEFSKVDRSMKSIICFYGPAGTGKTITAAAVAKHLRKPIIISSYAQIESKYVGEGAKNLRAIFKAAEEQDAVLFMDEADSFLSRRIESTESSSDKHYNRMSNELFQLLENHNGCIIFATNLMTDVDKAFKSRIVDSIFFELPNIEARVKILKKMISGKYLRNIFATESDIESFAKELNGFSGRDIRKSILLSYADIAPKIKTIGIDNYIWNIDEFRIGFDDVKETVEYTQDIPLNEVDEFIDNLKKNRKRFEIAKHAIVADGDDMGERERMLMNELSLQWLNKPLKEETMEIGMNLDEIILDADENFANELIDIVIRVASIDGVLSNKEYNFIEKLCSMLLFSEQKTLLIKEYATKVTDANSAWISSLKVS